MNSTPSLRDGIMVIMRTVGASRTTAKGITTLCVEEIPDYFISMFNKFYFILTFITALGSGIAGGVFFAFSSFVMKGLSRLNHDQGIRAMQSINITAVTPLFMSALFGTAVGCVILIVMSLGQPNSSGSSLILSGCIIYIVGIVLVTVVFNVPLNNELAAVNPSTAAGTEVWIKYLSRWVVWNHVRFLAGLASSAFLILGLIRYSQAH